MSFDLIVEMTPFGARTALMRHGDLLELRFADGGVADIRGQIFLARVKSLDDELDAAFVDCGRGLTAYLSGRDGRWVTGQRSDMPLHRQIIEGQAILVQGSGMGRDGKKPRVTSDILLTGMFQVYRPRRQSTKLSSKLSETGQSDRLFGLAKTAFPKGGVIYRGSAVIAADDELETESERLKTLWREIEAKAEDGRAPLCLFDKKDPLERVLHEALKPDIDRLIAADSITLAATRTFLESWLPALAGRLECQPGAFEVNGVNEQLEKATEPKVELKSGGSIIIEPTAAFTAIDVNSGGRRAMEANLEAAEEIARQLRLRRIGGAIVVDFINLRSQSDRARLMSALDQAFAGDPAAVKIYPPTPLGLVQISRQRLGQSLAERLGRPCPTCAGSGQTQNLRATTERLLGEAHGAGVNTIRVAVDLYSYIMTEAAAPYKAYIDRHGLQPPLLTPDETLPPGAYHM
ncbi:MAG: ribonuclease E/G [Alphaproteobacteria bacterium]|nr:ribonuclease E/G [Alphaproteobacteria bacterium]